MTSRRSFLGWTGLVGLGLLAHHKPGHGHGPKPPPTTTTTTTLPAPPTTTTTLPGGGADPYGDTFTERYEAA